MAAEDTEIFRYVGFKEEAVRGTLETSPEMDCDAASLDPGIPDDAEMEFKGSIGRGKTLHRPGFYSTKPKFEIGVDLKSLSRMLYGALGNRHVEVGEGSTTENPKAVLYYDDSGGSFTSKLTAFTNGTGNDVPIPGHAEAEIDDYLAIGFDKKYGIINFDIGTSKTDVSTLIWEYWTGQTWATLTTTDATVGFTETGSKSVTFTPPINWAKRSLNSGTAYFYVRVRCSAFTSAGTAGAVSQGTLGTQPDTSTEFIYSSNKVLLPSWTIFMGMDINEFQIPGSVMNKFELKVEDEFITAKCEFAGKGEELDTLRTEDELSLNEDYPLAFYEMDVHMRAKDSATLWGNDTLISQDVNSLTFKIDNSIKADKGKGLGSRFPYSIPAAERKVTVEFDYNYLENTYYELMQGGATGPEEGQGATEFEFMLALDAGDYGTAQFYFPRVICNAPVDAKGREFITQTVSIDAYQETVTPATVGEGIGDVYTDCLATFAHNFTDVSGDFDGPAEFDEPA